MIVVLLVVLCWCENCCYHQKSLCSGMCHQSAQGYIWP